MEQKVKMEQKDKIDQKTKTEKKPKTEQKAKTKGVTAAPCPRICQLVPTNVPGPKKAQTVLHPRKDVFVLRVAKFGVNGERRNKMELELVTPKGPEIKVPGRIDTKGTQCLPPPCAGCCPRIQC